MTATLDIGGLGLRLEGLAGLPIPERAWPFLKEPASSDFVIRVERGRPRQSAACGVEAVVWKGSETPAGFDLTLQVAPGAPPLAYCEVDVAAASARLALDPDVDWGPQPAWFTTLLQVLAAHLAVTRGGLLLHAAAVEVRGRAWLCAGDSGAGKTTLSRLLLAQGATLLADDRCLVVPHAGHANVGGAPWGGELPCRGGEVEASHLFFLEKGPHHERLRLGPAAATARLLAASLGPFWNPRMMAQALTVAQSITRVVPAEVARLAGDGSAGAFLLQEVP